MSSILISNATITLVRNAFKISGMNYGKKLRIYILLDSIDKPVPAWPIDSVMNPPRSGSSNSIPGVIGFPTLKDIVSSAANNGNGGRGGGGGSGDPNNAMPYISKMTIYLSIAVVSISCVFTFLV